MALVSIIVPIYNVERYLSDCIDSALNQTYRDLELILVDDGSPDGCGAICDAYAKKDSRIRVIHKPNGGLSDARNAGLNIASGKYVYFLDSDDTIAPNLLETVVPYMEQGADLVTFGLHSFYDDGTVLPPLKRECGTYLLKTPEERLAFFHKTLLQTKIGWEACLRIFSREKIEQYGLRFADNRKIFAEDLYFSLCYCAHAGHIVSLEDCFYHYRLRSDSIMGIQNTRNNLPRIRLLADSVLEHYRQHEDCTLFAENFPRLWYQIFMNQFIYQILNVEDQASFRDTVIREFPDWDAVSAVLKQQRKDTAFWKKQYSFVRYFEMTSGAEFLLEGNLRKFAVSNRIIRKIKNLYERMGKPVP